MRYLSILIFTFIFISCENYLEVHEYPDGISNSSNVIKSYGCGNIFVYQFLDEFKALTVRIDAKHIELTQKQQDFDLSDSNPYISVVLEIAGDDPDSVYFNYCNDVAPLNMGTTTKYKAVSGTLSLSVSEDNPIKEPIWESSYYVTISIENLHLINQSTNDEIKIDKAVFWNVHVGWLPG